MDTLHEVVQKTLAGYAVKGANYDAFLTKTDDGQTFTIIDIAVDNKRQHFVATSLVVRIVDAFVVIEYDDNDKPLVDALVQAGIPRRQIILRYAGEHLPSQAA